MAAALWSAEQQCLLRAMGYQLLRPVHVAAGQIPAAEATAGLSQLPAMNARSMRPRIALMRFPPSAESAQQQMLLAVSRAAGLSLDAVELVQASAGDVAIELPSLDALLSSAAARRALWPRLRTLKRELLDPTPR